MAGMELFEQFRRQAEVLGLKDNAITEFVLKQQETHFRNVEQQKERDERQRERAEKERDHERAMERLRLTKDRNESRSSGTSFTPTFADAALKPTLPVYRDGEDLNGYLVRFERVAELLNVPNEQWAIRLAGLLTGKAVEIYTSLTKEESADYES